MRFLLSVIGLAAVLWWAFVWRFDGKTPAQYAVIAWHSPQVQKKVKELKHEAKKLPKEIADELPDLPKDLPKFPKEIPWDGFDKSDEAEGNDKHKGPPAPSQGHSGHEDYTAKDRRTLDALVDRAQKGRHD